MRRLGGVKDSMDVNLGRLREIVRGREDWPGAVLGGREELDTT